MGAPGAGKGTQSRLLSNKFGYPQVSTGDILRRIAQEDTELGQELRATLSSGKLVSDTFLAEVILERTSKLDCEGGYILDGYPRTLAQAKLLEELAAKQKHTILLIRIAVRRETLLKRLTGRRVCAQCGEIYNIYYKAPRKANTCDLDFGALVRRSDDDEEKVSTRLQAYIESTAPLFDYYGETNRLLAIDGERAVEEIFGELINLLITGES